MNSSDGMTYAGSGVGYDDLDAFKREAMRLAAMTKANMEHLGFEEASWTRGESAYLFRHKGSGLMLAFVVEGLGTKNLVAEDADLRAMFSEREFYDYIGICNAAMNINDLLTLGALPIVFGMHAAVEDGKHLAGRRGVELVSGTYHAMQAARCTLGPGETPGLRGIIVPGTMCLGGACVGVVRSEQYVMSPYNVRAGQRILLLGSSGIHANGLTLARKIAKRLPEGYRTHVPGGATLGEELLTPTCIYAEFIRRCQDKGIALAYAVNVTGHGWRKLMRAPQPLTYVIERSPTPQPIFDFLMKMGPVSLREMYATFNMGAGFAVFAEDAEAVRAMEVASSVGIAAYLCGHIQKGDRQVVFMDHDIIFRSDELKLR